MFVPTLNPILHISALFFAIKTPYKSAHHNTNTEREIESNIKDIKIRDTKIHTE